jgi:hypothetical protein
MFLWEFGFNHLPLIDFRPFKVGANIQKEWKFLGAQSLS